MYDPRRACDPKEHGSLNNINRLISRKSTAVISGEDVTQYAYHVGININR
jgi:hypothetical protein